MCASTPPTRRPPPPDSPVRITRTRPGVLTLVATDAELSTLAAGARMALSLLQADPRGPAEAAAQLARVLEDYDRGIARLSEGDP
jgi:hypothetical protein